MSVVTTKIEMVSQPTEAAIQDQVADIIDGLVDSLPDPKALSAAERRGIIARYTAVLEGNFIYWMTAAYLAAQSKDAHPILLDNLREEIRDSHPAMLRRFSLAAKAYPTDADALAVDGDLTKVRLFLGNLSGAKTLMMMAFFEGFIQRFMIFLAGLAAAQGSDEQEYTSVHGVCDVTHSLELFRALSAEMAVCPVQSSDLFEGVDLLRALIEKIIRPEEEIS
jgi:hypothetical protein